MTICVYGAASSLIDNHYIEAGIELGKELAKRGHGLVFGGGSHGMMGALAEGAFEEKGYILGIIPEFFKEAGAEVSFKNCTEYIYTDTIERKIIIKTDYAQFKVSKTLVEMEEKLPSQFKHSHRACIVNCDRIRMIDKRNNKIIFDNDEKIDLLSKAYRKELV